MAMTFRLTRFARLNTAGVFAVGLACFAGVGCIPFEAPSDGGTTDLPVDGGTTDLPVIHTDAGVTGPVCVARVKSINGVDVAAGADPGVEPLDDVVVTLEDSTATGAPIATFSWTLATRPAGSTMLLTAPNAATTGFAFADAHGVDLSGHYDICGAVADSAGIQSTDDCCVRFDAIPRADLLVQMSWDITVADIDLHLTKKDADGRFCVSSTAAAPGGLASTCTPDPVLDCNFATCKGSLTAGATEWDGVDGRSAGDPVLDIDGIDGFGPEDITIDALSPGDYLVGVFAFTTPVAADTTTSIFVGASLVQTSISVLNEHDWREIAIVHVPSGVGDTCVEDLTDGDPADDCGP